MEAPAAPEGDARPGATGASGAPDRLVVARVLAAHGVRGELKCQVITDFPERFRRGVRVYLGNEAERRRIVSARLGAGQVFLRLEGIADRETAAGYRGVEVQVATRDAVKLPEGQFYWHQVIGLRVEDPAGVLLGSVTDIIETGANDVYVVQGERGEILVPAIREVVLEIDPERGRMVVDPLPGMLPEPRPERPRRVWRARPRRRGGGPSPD